MATTSNQEQSSHEERIYPIDWTLSLLTGVTVSDVTITHVPPSGDAATIGKEIASPLTYIKVPSGLAVGKHRVHCVATTSNAALSPEVVLLILVDH